MSVYNAAQGSSARRVVLHQQRLPESRQYSPAWCALTGAGTGSVVGLTFVFWQLTM
jgi:hypothetical protein